MHNINAYLGEQVFKYSFIQAEVSVLHNQLPE